MVFLHTKNQVRKERRRGSALVYINWKDSCITRADVHQEEEVQRNCAKKRDEKASQYSWLSISLCYNSSKENFSSNFDVKYIAFTQYIGPFHRKNLFNTNQEEEEEESRRKLKKCFNSYRQDITTG